MNMKIKNCNSEKWIRNGYFNNFCRQMSTDMMVGLKNQVREQEIKRVFEQFIRQFRMSIQSKKSRVELHWNVNKWLNDKDFIAFRSQMIEDINADSFNGVGIGLIEDAIDEFIGKFRHNMSGMWLRKKLK